MDYEALMGELRQIDHGGCFGGKKDDDVVEWTDDLTVYAAAYLMDAMDGELFEAQILTAWTAQEAGEKVGQFFVPPKFITDTPFPESTDIWWKAVTEILQAGDAFDDKGKPNYGAVVSKWKDKIAEVYGFRPTRSKKKSMGQDISTAVSQAARTMLKHRKKGGIDPEQLRKAAKLMGGQAARMKKKKAGGA